MPTNLFYGRRLGTESPKGTEKHLDPMKFDAMPERKEGKSLERRPVPETSHVR
jgi:hypothetical protein